MGKRTVFGKLTSIHKSGDGARVLTDRKQWTLDKFKFLNGHITKLAGRNVTSVSITTRQKYILILYVSLSSLKKYINLLL